MGASRHREVIDGEMRDLRIDRPDGRGQSPGRSLLQQPLLGEGFLREVPGRARAAHSDDPDPFAADHSSATEPEADREDSRLEPSGRDDGEGAAIGLGLVIVATASGLIGLVCQKVGYPLFALTARSVLPVGAYACGMVAGLGFWGTLRALHRRPTITAWPAAGLGGVAAYLLIFALAWWSMEDHGRKVRESVGFLEFVRVRMEYRAGQDIRPDFPVAVSTWGYTGFAINVVGFLVGFATMSLATTGKWYCSPCRRYFMRVGEQTRRSSDPEAAAMAFHQVVAALRAGRVQESLDLHAALDAADRTGVLTTTISVAACPSCGMHHATLVGSYPTDNNVAVAEGFAVRREDRPPRHDSRLIWGRAGSTAKARPRPVSPASTKVTARGRPFASPSPRPSRTA